MSEELVMLQEYFDSLGLDENNLTQDDLLILTNALRDSGENGLANFVDQLTKPEELLDYIGK